MKITIKTEQNNIPCEYWDRIVNSVKISIKCKSGTIKQNIDSYSMQFCHSIAEEMIEDFKLLEYLEEMRGKNEKYEND